MSLAQPVWLLTLLAIPALWMLYRWRRDRAKRFAVRFPAVSSLLAAVPATPAWRRHLPAALVVAAIAPLSVALAQPKLSKSVPINRASIVLVTDHSGSMQATDVDPTRLAAAESAADTFVDQLPRPVRVGIVAYSGTVDQVQQPTTNHRLVKDVVDAQSADGATATGDALTSALDLLARQGKGTPSAIVLLSDGVSNQGSDPVGVAQQVASRRKIPIFTVALGHPGATLDLGFGRIVDVSPDIATLRQIAQVSGGQAFQTGDSAALKSIYQRLGTRLGTRKVKREITAGFAIAGLFLLLGGAVAGHRRPLRVA